MTGKTKQRNAQAKKSSVVQGVSRFSDFDILLFKEGNHFKLYDKLGAHIMEHEGARGTYFAVWAPNAQKVSVIGDFNFWSPVSHPLNVRWDSSGIWEGFIPNIGHGTLYKYHIVSKVNHYTVQKSDPFAFYCEVPPRTASIVWDFSYAWKDSAWMKKRIRNNSHTSPISIYEMHLGSWQRVPEEGGRYLTYRETARRLVSYIKETGFTHVQFMPIMEHPFTGSWGYQITGFFAPTSRFGNPQDFMYLIDLLHQNDIGVFLDWVPSHFPEDTHGLRFFDGTHLYEHMDPKLGFHPDWRSYIFNYGRNEVKSFLISNGLFWLDRYHADGLRVDAVASMLYLDYSRKHGEWIPNEYGGKENLKALSFIQQLNHVVYENHSDVQMIAEESTAWPMVSRPTYVGGLGFGFKWNMGWMHDTLEYFTKDPVYRKHHHNQLTFNLWYAFTENFVLVLSHDEVVHGKGSLISKMPCDDWQKKANLKALFAYMYGIPGKKLLFMGGEFGQWREWQAEESLDWHQLGYEFHQQIYGWFKDLNHFYRNNPALYEIDFTPEGFEWIDFHDWEGSVISFIRKGRTTDDIILFVCNFTPVPRYDYRVGVPRGGFWKEELNSDAVEYGGSGHGNFGGREADTMPWHFRDFSISVTIPPLGAVIFKTGRKK